MKYCTNCGNETKSKICKNCGVKNGTTHKFCAWCANELDANATICTNCNEKIKSSVISIILNIINVIFAIFMFISALVYISNNGILSAIFFILSAVSALPFVKKLIRKNTINKPKQRKAFKIIRIAVIFVTLIAAFSTVPKIDTPTSTTDTSSEQEETIEYEIVEASAIKAAEEVFHRNVKLKNEASYVLNGAKVNFGSTLSTGLNLGFVELDYSAQNGFGGMTRDTYEVMLYFNKETGYYYDDNKTVIGKFD